MKRTFIAVPFEIPEELLALLTALKRKLKDEAIKWSEEGNLHVTIKFLGETSEDQINPISEILESVAPAFGKQEGVIKGVHYFSNGGNPSVIYGQLEGFPFLEQLASMVEKELELLGFPAEVRKFKAHLTLGRIRYLRDKKKFTEIISAYRDHEIKPLKAEKLVFFESILRPQGPVYKPLRTFGLRD